MPTGTNTTTTTDSIDLPGTAGHETVVTPLPLPATRDGVDMDGAYSHFFGVAAPSAADAGCREAVGLPLES